MSSNSSSSKQRINDGTYCIWLSNIELIENKNKMYICLRFVSSQFNPRK